MNISQVKDKLKMNKQLILDGKTTEIIHLSKMGNHSKALQKNKQLLKIYSDMPSLYNMAGALSIKCGKFTDAIKYCNKAIKMAPDYADAYNNLAAAHKEISQYQKAIDLAKKALSLNPDHVDAYINIGNSYKEMSKLDNALDAYKKAVSLNPKYAQAHFNVANTYREQGLNDKAIASYVEAIKLNPQLMPAYNNLAGTYAEIFEYGLALDCYAVLVEAGVNDTVIWQNLGDTLLHAEFTGYLPKVENLFVKTLQKNGTIRPSHFSESVLSFISHHPDVAPLLKGNAKDQVKNAIQVLGKNKLFLTLLAKTIIVEPKFESLLTEIRKFILLSPQDFKKIIKNLNLLKALALNCSMNEFVFYETEEEIEKISKLENSLSDEIAIYTLALYKPLSHYPQVQTTLKNNFPSLHKIYFEDVETEEKLKTKLNSVAEIENAVSQSIQQQYEENPYPRWVDTALYAIPRTYEEIAVRKNLISVKTLQKPEILVAGCGTGEHAITTARRFKNSTVTAIDLSKSSLAYALRKTKEYAISNIKYKHCDILKANSLHTQFDIIVCNGVLHHMDDPVHGWEQLLDTLKPNGLMQIGLYSKIARKPITNAKEIIKQRGLKSNSQSIRNFRKDIQNSTDEELKAIENSRDFYSLSNCRDSLFHIQEQHFTIPQLASIFKKLKLRFLGFEVDKDIHHNFTARYSDHHSLFDLDCWADFETKNPSTFGSMYQFWVQKSID